MEAAVTSEQMLELIEELQFAYGDQTYAWRGNVARVVALWHRSLGELPFEAVAAAVRRWIDTEPKLPHVSDIRAMIANAVFPVPSEAQVWAARFRYFRGEERDGDEFAFRVFRALGTARELGQTEEKDLREAVGFEYRRMVTQERSERAAHIPELLSDRAAVDGSRLKAVGS